MKFKIEMLPFCTKVKLLEAGPICRKVKKRKEKVDIFPVVDTDPVCPRAKIEDIGRVFTRIKMVNIVTANRSIQVLAIFGICVKISLRDCSISHIRPSRQSVDLAITSIRAIRYL